MLPDILRDRSDIRHNAALAEMIAGLTHRLDQLRPLAVSAAWSPCSARRDAQDVVRVAGEHAARCEGAGGDKAAPHPRHGVREVPTDNRGRVAALSCTIWSVYFAPLCRSPHGLLFEQARFSLRRPVVSSSFRSWLKQRLNAWLRQWTAVRQCAVDSESERKATSPQNSESSSVQVHFEPNHGLSSFTIYSLLHSGIQT